MAKPIMLKQAFCVRHGRSLPIENFFKSKNPNHGFGVLPYCKDCCAEIFDNYLDQTKNLEAAMWLTCSETGVPFLMDVFTPVSSFSVESADKKKNLTGKTYFGKYLSILQTRVIKNKSKSWDFSDTDVPLGEIKSVREREEIIAEQMKEFQLLWGGNYNIDDLSYLEWRYNIYTADKALTEYQASRYRDLCLCELRIAKDSDDKDAFVLKSKIAHELGEDSFTIDREKSNVEKIIENDIFLMEKHDPAEYYNDKEMFKDYIGIGEYWEKYVARPLRNLVIGSKDYDVGVDAKYGE